MMSHCLALGVLVTLAVLPGCADQGNGGNGGGFCSSHTCIPNFSKGTGYVVQCADGEWSHSGGRPGACSGHGGEM
jgi:hypothetical protein